MARTRRKFDEDFKAGAVRLVLETGKPIAQVARELGINEGTLGNWCARRRRSNEGGNPALSESGRAERRLGVEGVGARGAAAAADREHRAADAECSPLAFGGPLGQRGDGPVA